MKQRSAGVLLLILFLVTIFAHEIAEIPFEWFVANFSNRALKIFLNVVFGILLLGSIYFIQKRHKSFPLPTLLIYYLIVTLVFSAFSYLTLMPYKSEGMHFIQYALLAYVTMHWTSNIWISLNLVHFLGILDEWYQYALNSSIYFDFNDIVLNFFGGALGVIAFEVIHVTYRKKSYPFLLSHGAFLLNIGFVAGMLILLITGHLCIYREQGCPYTLCTFVEGKRLETFWEPISFGMDWHRVKPYEGMWYTVLLPIVYWPLAKLDDHSGKK